MSSHYFQYQVLTRFKFFVAFYHAFIARNPIRINRRTFSCENVPRLLMGLLIQVPTVSDH